MLEIGQVVFITAGKNAGRPYMVLEAKSEYCLIVDGKKRKLINPKKKNPKHLQAADVRLEEDEYRTDYQLRRTLQSVIVGTKK